MRQIMILLTVAALTACATTSGPMADGPPVAPPAGWTDFCARHPEEPRCS